MGKMNQKKRPLIVINEFEPFGMRVIGPSPDAAEEMETGGDNEDRQQLEQGTSEASGNGNGNGNGIGSGSGRYFLFAADSARVKLGHEFRAVMSGRWDHDQEIYMFQNKAVWSGGQEVHKQFSAPTTVLQAKWCRVQHRNEPILCILHSGCIMAYSPGGEMHSIPLQYRVSSMWPIPNGLLLQRVAEAPLVSSGLSTTPVKGGSLLPNVEERSKGATLFGLGNRNSSPVNLLGGGANFSSLAPHPAASILALLDPLAEPQAVLISDQNAPMAPVADTEERIVWTSTDIPYVVSYHIGKKCHSIWDIKFIPPTAESFVFSENPPRAAPPSSWEESGSFCLQRVWQEKSSSPQASQVFNAHDEDGIPILCLIVNEYQKLSAFRLPRREISEEHSCGANLDLAWSLEAISAVPIVALHPRTKDGPQYDLLVLSVAGNLSLYTGSHQMCNFFLPVKAAEIAASQDSIVHQVACLDPQQNCDGQQDEEVRVVHIQDAVADRVNVLTSSGKVFRCGLNLPFSSGITASCISAIAEGLRPSLSRYLLKHFLECDSPAVETLSLPTPDGKPDIHWAKFCDLILEIVRDMSSSSGFPAAPPSQPKAPPTSSWEFLLQSSMHANNLVSRRFVALPLFRNAPYSDCLPYPWFTNGPERESDDEMATYVTVMREILEVLHALYEDCKLDTLRWRQASQLARLLSHLAAAAGDLDYVDHYTRDFPIAIPPLPELPSPVMRVGGHNPPSLFRWVLKCIKNRRIPEHREDLPPMILREGASNVEWSRKVVGFYELLLGGPTIVHIALSRGTASRPEHKMVLAMVAESFSLPDLDRLPCGVSLPLRHALDKCREAPPDDWPPQAYILVGREDLASTCVSCYAEVRGTYRKTKDMVLENHQKNPVVDVRDAFLAAPYMLHLRQITTTPSSDFHEMGDSEGQGGTGVDGVLGSDGMDHMTATVVPFRFGLDLRLNEVRRLLGSSKPVAVHMPTSPDVSDPDIVAQQQGQLWQLAQRTMSLSFGRGAYTLATSYPLLTEALYIPKLVLAGRLPSQHDATVNLDPSTGNISELISWPEFHNGVAAGLKLALGHGKITRTWIIYNKSDEPSYSHAGFLMSLGLHKHLRVLAATDVYRYLAQEHEATTVGVLIGMAAACRGSMDPAMSKILYLHIPARHPPSFPELELPTLMQSAALMAVGLLYQGSAHRLTTEILLAEIGRKPGGDNALDREGYALAAGLALGLVTLGRGNDAWGLADLHIEERLRHYISGGSELSDDRHKRPDGPTWMSGNPSAATRNLDDFSHAGGQVMEGSMVNLDVTAPGATLALALMFLKTNNKMVAARLAVPSTHFALEYVRPDFILLRLVAQSLIMWDSVFPTEEWVQTQVPSIVKDYVSTVEGGSSETLPSDADAEALAQAHVNILAGACLSLALRYAGTARSDAQQVIRKYALYFLQEKRAAAVAASSNASPGRQNAAVDRGTLETCLDVSVLALSVVMAGTGHLGTFRLLRYLRRRNDPDGGITYGNHMAISMAIGFLFLGGGLRTFGTNNGAVAALLISLYPRFPTSPNDHRCHLQAFRHLYVLATEARCLQTADVDTGLPVIVRLELTTREETGGREEQVVVTRTTPCILPERCSLVRVRVSGPRYWPQDINLPLMTNQAWWEPGEAGDPFNGGMLYVKRRVGACSCADDPIGCRSLLSQAFENDTKGGKFEARTLAGYGNAIHLSKVDQLVSTFSGDPSMLAFTQLLSNFSQNSKTATEFENFCLMTLFECVSTDRPALLQTYLTLYTTVEDLVHRAEGQGGSSWNTTSSDSLALYNLKIAQAYCEDLDATSDDADQKEESLLQHNFLAALAKRVDNLLSSLNDFSEDVFDGSKSCFPDLVNYFNTAKWPVKWQTSKREGDKKDVLMCKTLLACYLCWYNIPTSRALQTAMHRLRQLLPGIGNFTPANSHHLLPVLSLVLPGTPTAGLLRISPCLPFLTHDHPVN